MLEKIRHKLLGLKRVAGVEVIFTSDGRIIFNLVILSINKGLISIDVKETNIEDQVKLKSLIGSETPVALTINGRGVLHKKASDSSLADDTNLISQVLPNAKESDFYMQKFVSGKNLFLSVIRKESYVKVKEIFKANQLHLIYAASGPFIAAEIIPFLKSTKDEIVFSGFKVSLKNNLITDFKSELEKSEMLFEMEGDKIQGSLLAAYASAFHLFLENDINPGLEINDISEEAEEFRNKNIFKLAGYTALCFFIVLMSLNYFFYNYYKNENNELSGKSSSYESMEKEITLLEKKVEEKGYFLERAGWLSVPRTSYFSDQIASTIPSSIKLRGISVNPLNEKQSKKERKQIFRADTIYVLGTCSNPTVLNPWMKELQDKKWVREANNINYTHDHKTGSGNFEIEIMVSDEF